MNPVAAWHGSSRRLGLVRVVGPKLSALAASATFLSLLPYLLRLTAQVVQPEEVHRHVCAQHASTRDQTTARVFSILRSILKETTILLQNICYCFVKHYWFIVRMVSINIKYISLLFIFVLEEKLYFPKKKNLYRVSIIICKTIRMNKIICV